MIPTVLSTQVGKAMSRADADVAAVYANLAKSEWSMRRSLWHEDVPSEWMHVPEAVLAEPPADAIDKDTKDKDKKDKAKSSTGSVPSLTFKNGGGIVDNQAAKFAGIGFKTGDFLKTKQAIGEVYTGSVGVVVSFSPTGKALTRFDPDYNIGLEGSQLVEVTFGCVLERCDKAPKKAKVDKVVVDLPTGFGWVLTDKDESAQRAILQGSLYKVLVSCSSGASHVLCVRSDPKRGGAPSIVASADIKAGALCFVPYHEEIATEQPDGACAKVVLCIKLDEKNVEEKVYWCKSVNEVIGNPNEDFALMSRSWLSFDF